MALQFTCPLCGHAFDPAAHLACQTCPLHSGCHLVCCPACGHTTVDQAQSRVVRWLTAIVERLPAQPKKRATLDMAGLVSEPCALADASLDREVCVVDVSALPAAQREQLHGYGLIPGRVVQVTQQTPVTVVRIEHTELAIESEVARRVSVRPS